MARENESWGYKRIQGQLSNMGFRIGKSSVANTLKALGTAELPSRLDGLFWAGVAVEAVWSTGSIAPPPDAHVLLETVASAVTSTRDAHPIRRSETPSDPPRTPSPRLLAHGQDHCQWRGTDQRVACRTGTAKHEDTLGRACSASSNRLVRTRMLGGVGRAVSDGRPSSLPDYVLAGVEARECRYSGAKSAPFGHASVCPMIENDLKYSTSRSGSKIGPSNESDRSMSAVAPSLNDTRTRWSAMYSASVTCKNIDLLQRLDRIQGLSSLDEFPVSSQFVLMKIVPIQYCCQRSPRKPTLDDAAVDVDSDFMLPILRVEVWRGMIAIVHPNHNSKESADFRHSSKTSVVLRITAGRRRAG